MDRIKFFRRREEEGAKGTTNPEESKILAEQQDKEDLNRKERTQENQAETTLDPDRVKQEIIDMINHLITEIKAENDPKKQQAYLNTIKSAVSNLDIQHMYEAMYTI